VLSSSVNAIGVKFDAALPPSASVPKEPAPVEKTGVSLIDKQFASDPDKLEELITFIS